MIDDPHYGCGCALLAALGFWAIVVLVAWVVLR